MRFTAYNKGFVVNTNISNYFTTDDRLEFWGQIGGYAILS